MSVRYSTYSGANPSAAGLAKIATGTAIKTIMQLAPAASQELNVVRWGIDFDGSAAGTPILCELLVTTVAATVTAQVAAGITPVNKSNTLASRVQLGTALTGYNASAEGAVTTTRPFDVRLVPPTSGYSYEWQDGRLPTVNGFLRVRVTAAASVGCVAWIEWEE